MKAIIFDLDGVLIDSTGLNTKALKKALVELGYTIPPEFVVLQEAISTRDKLRLLGLVNSDEDIKKVRETKNRIYFGMLHEIQFSPYLQIQLEQIRTSMKVKLACVTNNSRDVTNTIFRLANVEGVFDVVVTQDDVMNPKPSPEGYLLALRLLGCSGLECRVYEDSDAGFTAATRAGIPTEKVTFKEMERKLISCVL